MENKSKELGCCVDFWPWDCVSLDKEQRRSKAGLKIMNSVFNTLNLEFL